MQRGEEGEGLKAAYVNLLAQSEIDKTFRHAKFVKTKEGPYRHPKTKVMAYNPINMAGTYFFTTESGSVKDRHSWGTRELDPLKSKEQLAAAIQRALKGYHDHIEYEAKPKN